MAGAVGIAAWAATPPAGTKIGNQASATYLDPNGNSQLATSNKVETEVQQVGSFTLDGANSGSLTSTTVQNTKTGAAGATVYAPHVLTNTGNGTDNFKITVTPDAGFSKVEIYADTNADGLPDGAALCSITNPAAGVPCATASQTVAGNSGTFQFVVAYSLPTTATTPTTPYSFGTVSAEVDSASSVLASYPSTQTSNRDNVNLTTLAAFDVTKAIGAPAVAAPGGGTWIAAPSNGERSSSASCSTTFASIAPSASCQYTVYTIRITNTGGGAGRFAMQDVLPAGFTYVSGSSVWSNSPGTALTESGTPSGGIDYKVTGNTVSAVVQNMAPNTTQTISMVVLVNNTAAVGFSSTTNTVTYNPLDAAGATTSALPTLGSASNPAVFTVTPTYGFAIGSASSTATTARDTVAGTPNAGADDNSTVGQAAAGSTVSFVNTVHNTGNIADAIDLSIASSGFPAGTVFNFYAADGVTPLLNTGGNANVDTGPVAAGGSVNIVVKAILPSSAIVGSGPLSATVLGTSAASPSTQAPGDATNNVVTAVVGSLVDLTATSAGTGSGSVADGDLGPGPSPLPTVTKTTSAGLGTVFVLYITNNDTVTNTYNLAASQSSTFPGSLPVGWTVKFVGAGGNCASAPITSIAVTANDQTQVAACVTPPASAVAATTTIYFQAQSQNVASSGVIVQDAMTNAVTVTELVSFSTTLTPSNSGQVAAGGSVVFAHTLANLGTQSCAGGYTLSATVPAEATAAGWGTPALYLDANGDGEIDPGDTLVTGPQAATFAAGQNQQILVKQFAPAGATAGASTTITVVATFADTQCGSPTATDSLNVITGQIRVVKTQAIDIACDGTPDTGYAGTPITAKPSECIIYQVVATNEGAAPVTNLSVKDGIPAFTNVASATQPAVQCTSSGITGTPVAFSSDATSVTCGSSTNVVAPNGSATLGFAVQINP